MSRVFWALSLAAVGLVFTLTEPTLHSAEIKPFHPFLHPLFNSHMVFPRDVEAPVWGWTEPGAKVSASMLGKTADGTAGADGRWALKLGPFPAGGPCVLTVKGAKDSVTLDDVLVGDVWLCSGQSNMTMGIRAVDKADEEIANANHPKIRLFDQPPWLKEGKSCKWSLCTPEEIVDQSYVTEKTPDGKMIRCGFSATAYFFGRGLQKELDVPIGLVQTSAPRHLHRDVEQPGGSRATRQAGGRRDRGMVQAERSRHPGLGLAVDRRQRLADHLVPVGQVQARSGIHRSRLAPQELRASGGLGGQGSLDEAWMD